MFFGLIDKIVKVVDVFDCYVCEVGVGLGFFIRFLLYVGFKYVVVVEIDRRFFLLLEVF